MYDLHDYARMIADDARIGPYVRALETVVHSGSVVADVGSGTGVFALVACRLGARRVYAIETNDAIEVARELARENGFADRILFFPKDAREVELPERADVLVSDLRGALPLFGEHLAIIADVRERFLKPSGVLIPQRDRLMVAVVEKSDLYDWALGPRCGPLGVTLQAMRVRLGNRAVSDCDAHHIEARDVVTDASPWATLDYATERPGPLTGASELRVLRAATGHGLAVWFETVLAGEHGFSSAPGVGAACYSRLFLPWPRPVALSAGDAISVQLLAQPDGEPWAWNSSVPTGNGGRESFKQSSFLSTTSKPSPRGRKPSETGGTWSQGIRS